MYVIKRVELLKSIETDENLSDLEGLKLTAGMADVEM